MANKSRNTNNVARQSSAGLTPYLLRSKPETCTTRSNAKALAKMRISSFAPWSRRGINFVRSMPQAYTPADSWQLFLVFSFQPLGSFFCGFWVGS